MKDLTARAIVPLACALLVFSSGVTAQNKKADSNPHQQRGGKKGGDESWEIVERMRWLNQTLSLDDPRAKANRTQAIEQLRIAKRRLAPADQANGQVWTEIGPAAMKMTGWSMGTVAGRINAIAPHPSNDDTVYVGTANGGVWKTTNAGGSWTPLFSEVASQSIASIHIEKDAPQNIWAGTGDRFHAVCSGYLGQGVFLSSDGGATWTDKSGSGDKRMRATAVTALLTLPGNSNVLLAGGAGERCSYTPGEGAGLYRSADRGASWTQVFSKSIEDVVPVPGQPNTLFMTAGGDGVYKSTDAGVTWAKVGSNIAATNRMRLVISPSSPSTMYVLTESQLYRSSDSGASWTLKSNSACEGQCFYDLHLAIHPTNPDTVIASSIRPLRSTNGGQSLAAIINPWGQAQQVHQDIHAVVYSQSEPNRIWVGGDGGLWRTENGGSSWTNMNSNLNTHLLYDVSVHPDNADIVWAGAQDNASSRRKTSNVWDVTVANGDGFMNEVDEANPAVVFQMGYPSGSYPSVYRSTSGGEPGTFGMAPTSGLGSGGWAFLTPLASAGGFVFVGSSKVYRSPAAGTMTWTEMSGVLSGTVRVMTPQKVGSAVHMYVGTSDGHVFYTADASTTGMTRVTGTLPQGKPVLDIAVDPTDGRRVFVARGGLDAPRLARSGNAGQTWENGGAGLPAIPATAVSIDPLNRDRIFVGTDVGVYESTDAGANFRPLSTGLPTGLSIMDLEVDDNPHVLVAATFGRGAWKLPLAGGSDNVPPVAGFSFAANGRTVTFTDSSTDADGKIVQRNWNFGDGTNSAETNPVKLYTADGAYNVILTVTDDKGGVATETKTVTVKDTTPDNVLVNNKPVTDLSGKARDERFWTMEVPAGANSLKFSLAGTTGDADLYVKFGSAPTPSSYDCRSYSTGSNEVCDMSNVLAGTYHVMVRGFRDYSGVTLLGSYASNSGAQTYANEADVTIVDKDTVESLIKVSGRSGNANAASKIAVGIIHTYIGDLKVELIAPDGTAYLLHNRSGGSTDNIDMTYSVDLSSKPLNGEWKLRVFDGARGDSGKIDRWSITF